MVSTKNAASTPIDSVRHKDKRVNIPTEELSGFMADDERNPQTILYPRDPSLDPQLVWQGKDEQDRLDLAVPAVPIYIQEKIHPQAIVEELRTNSQKDGLQQVSLFSDFDGIAFDDMIDFYQHEQNWTNRMILGDSLLVMSSLAEKEAMKGKVQTIYLDPPYGIKFGSNWQVSTSKRDVSDGKAQDVTRQPEQVKAFRDTWELGIHSYLSHMRDRLVVARELLTDSGSVFVQIGDANLHLVRCLLDEVFGSEHFVAAIPFRKTSGAGSLAGGTTTLAQVCDYLLWYAKDKPSVKYRQLYLDKNFGEEGASQYQWLQLSDGTRRRMTTDEANDPRNWPPHAKVFGSDNLTSASGVDTTRFPVTFEGKTYVPHPAVWKTSSEGMRRLQLADRLIQSGKSVLYVRYLKDFPQRPLSNIWDDTISSFMADKIYVVQTNLKVVQRCILMTTDPGDLVLDPTCGSGTTAYVAEQWGRRWITIDTSRVALALARMRLMVAKYPYYMLADSMMGQKKEGELTGKALPIQNLEGDIRKGFVYKRVSHITLKSIANNPDIDGIDAKWADSLNALRDRINRALNQHLEEWQIPHGPQMTWPDDARNLLKEWWNLRQERQKEIDTAIARNADNEVLYDQPYEDNKRIRVTGPFTIESLSPHRVLSTDDDRPLSESEVQEESEAGQFETIIMTNLKKAGVQNTIKDERIQFDRLEPYAGTRIQAEGQYTDKNGEGKRVAVFIGPEYDTVGADDVKEAAKEAIKGIGFDLLIVCGFAFDPYITEEAKQFGKLPVLIVRMNPDLMMGDELLKKTGSANLFMVFGEPDIEVKKEQGGKLTVEIKGVDVYDPTTGKIRNSSTKDIACWFVDTNYNGESFFVRHAYFTGGNDPYEKLRKALRAEIDETAWSQLYSTESYPFDRPKTGKIAVKVINHYGDEVLKVYGVA